MSLLVFAVLVVLTGGVLLAIPITATVGKSWSPTRFGSWMIGVALYVTWAVSTTLSGYRADAGHTEGDLSSEVGWLIGASVAAVGALFVTSRGGRRHRDPGGR